MTLYLIPVITIFKYLPPTIRNFQTSCLIIYLQSFSQNYSCNQIFPNYKITFMKEQMSGLKKRSICIHRYLGFLGGGSLNCVSLVLLNQLPEDGVYYPLLLRQRAYDNSHTLFQSNCQLRVLRFPDSSISVLCHISFPRTISLPMSNLYSSKFSFIHSKA